MINQRLVRSEKIILNESVPTLAPPMPMTVFPATCGQTESGAVGIPALGLLGLKSPSHLLNWILMPTLHQRIGPELLF